SLKNKTILFLSNDCDYYDLADDIFLLKDGNLIKYDSIEELFKNEKKNQNHNKTKHARAIVRDTADCILFDLSAVANGHSPCHQFF
ncbi:MAG: hypothetical protein J6Q06_04390, partial [Clostridia bacterium]|nr:hypothetical protein [Clostridia bacterium]